MVAVGTRAVLIVGILIGATIVGGLLGAGIDFVGGSQGWWGVGALGGLMAAAAMASSIVERGRAVRR